MPRARLGFGGYVVGLCLGDRMKRKLLLLFAALGIAGCATQPASSPSLEQPYRLATASDGKVYRINAVTGETWLVVGDSMRKVSQSGITVLEVGRKYFIERSRSMTYLGDGKFTEPVPDYGTLWN